MSIDSRQKALAEGLGIATVPEISNCPFVKEKIQKIPYAFAKTHKLLAIDEDEQSIFVAISDPLNMEAIEALRLSLKKNIKEILASKEQIEEALELCYQQSEENTSALVATLNTELPENVKEEDGYDLLEQRSGSPMTRMLDAILLEAIQQGVSDIHFEPLENELSVRYRIDGVLQKRHSPPKECQSQLMTKLKVMAKLDITEQRLPQDGRIKLKVGERQIDFRVSTLPVIYGERIVLRILDKSNVFLGLDRLGIPKDTLEAVLKMIRQSEGIVLVTGPTGSGKTTTLYSAISQINSSEVNVMTIEDPVEYKMQGMAQVGVNPKIQLYFSTGLRHILRQDPDVIMIGEIRDKETAEIAIQASLTGHLVLSTLHTNDAPSALTRLVDMEIEPYLLSSSVLGALAQRLVRTICLACRVSYTPLEREKKELNVHTEALLYKGEGCALCYGSGYRGRRGIYELMVMGGTIKQQLGLSADANALKKIAIENGMRTLREEGAKLVLEGVTTSAEVLRVTRGCEEI